MEIIQNSIKCFECKQTLTGPVLLPCGESICERHVREAKDGEMLCGGCGEKHTVPASGFPRNKGLENIIKTQIDRLNLGAEHDQALKSCHRLNSILSEISLLRTDPNYFIDESIGDIRRHVESIRIELKMKIDAEADRLIGELNAYEASCRQSTSGFSERLDELEEAVREPREKLAEWFEQFKTIDLNETKWRAIKLETEKINDELEKRVSALKQTLLLNRFAEFRLKPYEFNEIDLNENKFALI